jgi:hypothetical protein
MYVLYIIAVICVISILDNYLFLCYTGVKGGDPMETINVKKWLVAELGVALVILGVFLWIHPFKTDVSKELTATVYVDGVAQEQTTVCIDGEISKRLFRKDRHFGGTFAIAYYPTTCDPRHSAHIHWDEDGYQVIDYLYPGGFVKDYTTTLTIDESMDHFAVEFFEGTVIATTEDLL